ncbi:hypothetical protein [Pectobacterium versatile]|uniref:hypothetical protein n=1 Tax=Pectobacterium versatile TaxID=2488639 RepID=UPI002B25451E|nr:hypothetical protein [Pectobacterium versatile]
MSKLKDIINRKVPSQANAVTILKKDLLPSISKLGITQLSQPDKVKKFTEQAVDLITQDDFLDELEISIGLPKDNETEDEFVSRAKSRMKALLTKKLK